MIVIHNKKMEVLMKRVQNKVAVVTGGSLGIGKSSCELLAKEGARVAVTDIKDSEGKKVVADINESGGTAKYWHLDTSNEKEVEKVFSEVIKEYGKIDILVNNAGIAGVNKPTHEVDRDEWKKVIDVNINGVFYCTKHVVPYMKENKGGSIINMSSIYGIQGAADLPPYHASKGA